MWFEVAAMPRAIGSLEPIRTDDSSRSGASVPFEIGTASFARTASLGRAPGSAGVTMPESVAQTDSPLRGFMRLSNFQLSLLAGSMSSGGAAARAQTPTGEALSDRRGAVGDDVSAGKTRYRPVPSVAGAESFSYCYKPSFSSGFGRFAKEDGTVLNDMRGPKLGEPTDDEGFVDVPVGGLDLQYCIGADPTGTWTTPWRTWTYGRSVAASPV